MAALILDNGQGPVVKLNLGSRDDLVPAIKKFADSVKSFGEVTVDDNTVFGTVIGHHQILGKTGHCMFEQYLKH